MARFNDSPRFLEEASKRKYVVNRGDRYGKLICQVPSRKNGITFLSWVCLCDCGKYVTVTQQAIRKRGDLNSCGCDREARRTANEKYKVIPGQKFNQLTTIKRLSREVLGNKGKRRLIFWLCKCDCGNKKEIRQGSLTSGLSKSCGCNRLEKTTKHGMSHSAVYSVWCKVKQSGHPISDRWMSFEKFLEDVGEKPSSRHQFILLDKDLGYFPDNAKWILPEEQYMLTVDGVTKTVLEWAEEIGITPKTLHRRLAIGWDSKRAVTTGSMRTKYITINDTRKSVIEWAQISGNKEDTIRKRLRIGWDPEKAVFYRAPGMSGWEVGTSVEAPADVFSDPETSTENTPVPAENSVETCIKMCECGRGPVIKEPGGCAECEETQQRVNARARFNPVVGTKFVTEDFGDLTKALNRFVKNNPDKIRLSDNMSNEYFSKRKPGRPRKDRQEDAA